ncbi:hypothetical protein SKAU_G00114040 [Synaphobranchus kaupii]|uniref:chitinase n=1 Tax=Synaphobranchus kaupii TaxID=118154 RepID=A0A9Q1G253_SYNKA|nr:hypothetical protein SKAU_G00114040 [Synaphobranchus kaupii]
MGKVLLVTALALLLNAQLGSSYILSCYFTNWAQYRPPPTIYMPTDIDPCLCTHLLYAFATMKNNMLATYEWNDVELYGQFNALKNKFSAMVASPELRKTFIDSVVVFLRKYEFDGLDIDWEYPANRGSPPQDQQLFSVLLEEMKAAFEAEAKQTNKARLLMSAAVSSGRGTIDSAYQIPQLGQSLDMINVMTYDMHGSWDPFTGECSPLYRGPADHGGYIYFNVDYAMHYWQSNGAPAEKLLVGFPTYGSTFTLTNPANHGCRRRCLRGRSCREICGFLEGATEVWNTPQDTPYAYKGTQWVGYDNVKSFKLKVQWLMKNKFAGAMVWTIDMDDYMGTFCKQGKYPLISVLHKAFGLDQASCSAPATPRPPIKGMTTTGGSSGGTSGEDPGNGTKGMDSTFCVGKANGMYPNPTNKNQFYNCSGGKTYFQNCASGLVFDTSCSCCNWS